MILSHRIFTSDIVILSQLKVEKVKKTGTFEELVMLHRLIQDVHVKIDGVADKDDCIPERYGKGGHSGNPVFKLEGPALKNSGMDLKIPLRINLHIYGTLYLGSDWPTEKSATVRKETFRSSLFAVKLRQISTFACFHESTIRFRVKW